MEIRRAVAERGERTAASKMAGETEFIPRELKTAISGAIKD